MSDQPKNELFKLRHTVAHLLAAAVQALYPDAKRTIGPVIENGFYYDFDKKEPFVPEDLAKIELKMQEIIKADYSFEAREMKKEKALELFEGMGEKYKAELIKEITENPQYEFEGINVDIDKAALKKISYKDILKQIFNAKSSGNIEVLKIPNKAPGPVSRLKAIWSRNGVKVFK